MRSQKIRTVLGVVLAFACAATSTFAQGQSAGAASSADQEQSAAALAQQATNPFSNAWLMQIQQNNNSIEMPQGHGNHWQNNLMFQPLMNLKLTDQWGLYLRPVLTTVNSVPYLDGTGRSDRSSGFGDTVLGIAAAHPLFGGRLVVGAGPTFIFPTASQRQLGEDTWQIGPDVGATLLGQHFIAYGFVQQWFKVGGSGAKTNHMNGVFNYTYSFRSGWTVGTQPSLTVDREADQTVFSIGPQVGKLCKCGGLPTLMQVQVQYYAIAPSVGGPKWNVQFQLTPTIPALIKKRLF
jgi:hypothetical protein